MPVFQAFVGGAYQAQSIYQDDQACINFYPEIDPDPGAKAKASLYGTPGSVLFCQLDAGTQVRGCWVLPGSLLSVWVAGSSVYIVDTNGNATFCGSLGTTQGPVHIRDNTVSCQIVDGLNIYTLVIATKVLSVNAAANALFTANVMEYSDGFFIFPKLTSQLFYVSDLNATTFTLPYFGGKNGSSDNLVSIAVYDRQLWLLGERTTELWQNTGGVTLPYSRIEGAFLQYGCISPHAIANMETGTAWLSRSERGNAIVVKTTGFTPQRISTHAIETAMQSYTTVSDAIALVYQHNGHEFLEITFPSADVTWVYDSQTNLWHQRGWWDQANGVFHRARANCICNFAGQTLVGDYANGGIYAFSDSVYTEAGGTPLVSLRRAPHLQDDHKQQFFEMMQIEFQPGVGTLTGQGSNPQAMLRWSDDGGSTWSSEHYRPIGATGQYKNRTIWFSLGASRDRIFEVRISDPVPRRIINATLLASTGDH